MHQVEPMAHKHTIEAQLVVKVEGYKVTYKVNGQERVLYWKPRMGKKPMVGDYIHIEYGGLFRCIKSVTVVELRRVT
jgi:uncharacterized protein YcfJ